MPEFDLTHNFKTKSSVMCTECGAIHPEDSDTYLTLYGNLCVGKFGGILGGGNWEAYGIPVTIMCRGCFVNFVREESDY